MLKPLPLIPDVDDHNNSGFRAILKALAWNENLKIVDVGAGGFGGQTTTVHLIELLKGQIDAIELHPGRAEALREALGAQINVIQGDVQDYRPDRPIDLLVMDIDSNFIPKQFTELLPALRPHLSPQALAIAVIVYDGPACYDAAGPMLSPANHPPQKAFMESYFGSEVLTPAIAEAALARHGWSYVGLVDKWMGLGMRNALGWLVFRPMTDGGD